jgi:hypothetical protein
VQVCAYAGPDGEARVSCGTHRAQRRCTST